MCYSAARKGGKSFQIDHWESRAQTTPSEGFLRDVKQVFAVHFTFRRGGGWGKGRRKYRGGRSAGEGGVGVFRRNADRLY